MLKAMGLCLGSSSVSVVEVEKDNGEINIINSASYLHDGNAKGVIEDLFNKYNLWGTNKIAVTGRKFRNFINLSSISEPEAVEYAYDYLKQKYNHPNTIVSAGGETSIVYQLDREGKIANVLTGNKCASGTGEFFLQQIKRMNIDVETATEVAEIDNPHKVSGRCSVFCKSDCTHSLNKGEHKGKIVAGLCQMMANKILELLKKVNHKGVLFIGGTSKNKVMIDYIKRTIDDLIVADEAEYFEALGTAIWALDNDTQNINSKDDLFIKGRESFNFLPPLKDYVEKVTFKEIKTDTAKPGDACIIGLDVGSTTTKAILLRLNDNSIIASEYLRTNGDPIWAAKECYRSLSCQVEAPINIIGLGVTGSGRQIAGLHALTDGITNEIIAHATAAVYFDPEVDTIFEIGGQDAKYTFITNKVPSDYAMNEACSAGTGSFLEESAKESMGIDMYDIAKFAMESTNPPNFNDQCAAFIGSDIKNAIQEGIKKQDIAAGLVYSICQNYSNRVKGNRAVGKKIFMQGGVCYNKAVPIAMAAFTGNQIIVPPMPGLMGAFGAALEVKNKINLGLLKEQGFDLEELSNRQVEYKNNFICSGGKEKCDRKCNINVIHIKEKDYPFGGACNKYTNTIKNIEYDYEIMDLVMLREKLVFEKYAPRANNNPKGLKIGINKSLLVNSLYPLYYNFFTKLGLNVVLGDTVSQQGIDKKSAPFCYPVELSHGLIEGLLDKGLDYIFLPQVIGMYVENGIESSVVCPLAQAEPYYLKTAFNRHMNLKVISAILNFSEGYGSLTKEFIRIGQKMGFSKRQSLDAYEYAVNMQNQLLKEMREIGAQVINQIEKEDKIGIVLFGRPYNAFTKDANLGIPHKFASRGFKIIPFDFLPYTNQPPIEQMYWSMGQSILKCAKFVADHDKLFGVFITNFSCGPDSFVVGYFRDIFGSKPSLTLELDSHTADAGIDTRIEAFLDIVQSYIEINSHRKEQINGDFRLAYTFIKRGELFVVDSDGQQYPITHEKVHVIIPSMGDIGSKCLAASFRHSGINASSFRSYTESDLKVGRANASCKECLPLMLTVGGLLNYIENRTVKDEILVYFMPETCGPCRFGQYNVLTKNVIRKNKLRDVAVLSLNSEDGYGGLGVKFTLSAWRSIVISDVLNQIYSAVLVLSKDKDYGLKVFDEICNDIIISIGNDNWKQLKETLRRSARKLSTIPVKYSIEKAKKIGLVGEIFVRHDSFSAQNIIEKLAEKDIITKIAPMAEWVYYCDYIIKKDISHIDKSIKDKINVSIEGLIKIQNEAIIKKIFCESGLYEYKLVNVDQVINNVEELISPKLTGEAILTTGLALTEIIDDVSGVISIGPFGCMPSRIAQAVISDSINTYKKKISSNQIVRLIMNKYPTLPFLPIETDGNVFPPIIQARLETFCLQVDRVHNTVQELKSNV